MTGPNDLRPRTRFVELEPVFQAWSYSRDLHKFDPGASEQQIIETEKNLGKLLPRSIRAIYEASDGATLFGSAFSIYPLMSSKLCLATMSDNLRSRGWGIPSELLVFGSNNSDATYGLWIPNSTVVEDAPVVVLGGSNSDFGNMALAGSTFARFIRWITAYCLLDGKERTSELDALEVPPKLRKSPGTYEVYVEIAKWADPNLPDYPPDPYGNPVSHKWLQKRFGSAVT